MQETEQIAQFIADTTYDRLPDAVVKAAKTGILDGVANLLAGSTQPLAATINRYVEQMGGRPDCSVVGRGYKTNAFFAAFANGVFLHCLDFEIQGAIPTHGTSACLPPALALGEMNAAAGRHLIAAYVIGWELQARLRTATAEANLRGFHPPGIFGPIGAVAASASVLGLNRDQVRMALGIAASHTGGLTANTGTMVKATHPGSAARQGVEAALLASSGFISNDHIVEARQGYLDVLFGNDCDRALLTGDLGTTFQLVQPGFNIKHYPAQVYMQWPIEAALMLRRQHDFRLEDVDYLEMEVPAGRSGSSRPNPASGLDGKFSFEYCTAVAVANGEVNIASFSDDTRFSPPVEALLRKVRVKPNADIPGDIRRTWAVARVRLQDGREFSERCDSYRGAIANPMSRDEHLGKVRDCARRVLRPDDIERTIDMVERLEELDDLRQLTAILNQTPATG